MCVRYSRSNGKVSCFCKLAVLSAAIQNACWQIAVAEENLPPAPTLQNPGTGANLSRFFSSKTPYEFWLACLIGLLGLVVIITLIVALRQVKNARPEDIARPVIVLTVIMGTLILVTVGYSNDQIAPAFGLFGTIIGYMLGRISQSTPAGGGASDLQRGSSTTNQTAGAEVPGGAKQ